MASVYQRPVETSIGSISALERDHHNLPPDWLDYTVPKPLNLYTQHHYMGKRNKVLKLTDKKIRYIIRAETNNISTKCIALGMKVSEIDELC